MVVVVRVIDAAAATVGADDAVKRANARISANVLETIGDVRLVVLVMSGTGRVPAPPADVGEDPPREAISKFVITRLSERRKVVTYQQGLP